MNFWGARVYKNKIISRLIDYNYTYYTQTHVTNKIRMKDKKTMKSSSGSELINCNNYISK